MKLDRLLAIVLLLLSKRKMQAKELAEIFEVSVRTIYRDIETISLAGIPVITTQGTNGGIAIMDGYRLEKNWLSDDELASVATALKSVSTTIQDEHVSAAFQKIARLVPKHEEENFRARAEKIFIDFSPWGKDPALQGKFDLIMAAIEGSQHLSFTYVNAAGEQSRRTAEPHTLVQKQQKWYLYAFCTEKNQFRFFKLSRMRELECRPSVFQRREIALEERPWVQAWHRPENFVDLVLKIDPKVKSLAEEWFGPEKIQTDGTGGCLAEITLPLDEWLFSFLLSFGPFIEVLDPVYVREKVKEQARKVYQLYKPGS
ncbi:helix-turn-helix transcriptional regulator [Brevibacillus sp. B_LB10_24]|uniref:helix-turn-helix transcriptional regulator n=1 Tax=Brevibacillus sp. B_LB10_24 TaxID=3380645 RepID=UPI0038BB3A27